MKQLHIIQLSLLKKLLFSPELRYSDLRPHEHIENNQLDFHLDQLIKAGYVVKLAHGTYSLTADGKDYANRMDPDQSAVPKQAKIGVVLCCVRGSAPSREYLIYTRTKHPFYGCQGFMSGKIRYGEQIVETAMRELYEETGLSGTPLLVSLKHYRVFSVDRTQILEDKIQFFYLFHNPTGNHVQSDEGKTEWVAESHLDTYVTKPFVTKDEFWSNVRDLDNFSGTVRLEEIDQIGDQF